MSTHNIYFHGEIRKINHVDTISYLELYIKQVITTSPAFSSILCGLLTGYSIQRLNHYGKIQQ